MAADAVGTRTGGGRRRGGLLLEEAVWGWLLQIPNIIGLSVFAAGPLIASLALVFMNWDGLVNPPTFAGLDNINTLINDPLFPTALWNTAYITFISVPLYMVLGLLLALALHQNLRGMRIYRVIFFLPSQVPAIANVILWLWLFNPDYGLVNWVLDLFHLPTSTWVQDPAMAKPALILMGCWSIGTGMIIYLAGLQGIPQELYEAASIDGAGAWRRFRNVTLPLLTPVIFFSLIIGIINTMQSGFTTAFLFTTVNTGSSATVNDSGDRRTPCCCWSSISTTKDSSISAWVMPRCWPGCSS